MWLEGDRRDPFRPTTQSGKLDDWLAGKGDRKKGERG